MWQCVYGCSRLVGILPCSLLFFLPPFLYRLSFTEIVNQLNALSCLHGDDDDDEGVLKRARKATAKPAASSQGLFSPFFHLFHPVFLTLLMVLWTLCLLYTTNHYHYLIFLKSSSPLFLFFSLWFKPHIPWSSFTWYCDCVVVLQFILVHVVMCCTNCCEHIIWCSFFWFLFFVFFDSVAFPILLLQLVVNQTREMESKWNFHTQKRTERQKLRCFVFKLDLKWVWFPVELHIGSVVFSKLYLFHSGQKSH